MKKTQHIWENINSCSFFWSITDRSILASTYLTASVDHLFLCLDIHSTNYNYLLTFWLFIWCCVWNITGKRAQYHECWCRYEMKYLIHTNHPQHSSETVCMCTEIVHHLIYTNTSLIRRLVCIGRGFQTQCDFDFVCIFAHHLLELYLLKVRHTTLFYFYKIIEIGVRVVSVGNNFSCVMFDDHRFSE